MEVHKLYALFYEMKSPSSTGGLEDQLFTGVEFMGALSWVAEVGNHISPSTFCRNTYRGHDDRLTIFGDCRMEDIEGKIEEVRKAIEF